MEWREYHEESMSIAGMEDLRRTGVEISAIAGRNLLSWCEGCGDPILEGEKYLALEDATLCRRCRPSAVELNSWRELDPRTATPDAEERAAASGPQATNGQGG
ncbi:MAG: hypothetical protein FJW69_09200 [Actinobacteria bacterium]|nr:hypothetical protein [Actinomycetota bacterium]